MYPMVLRDGLQKRSLKWPWQILRGRQVAQCNNLIPVAMEVLGCRDTREMNRVCASPHGFQQLRKFLKGVLVIIKPGDRIKRISDIVQRAGYLEFPKDGQTITVAVSADTSGPCHSPSAAVR